MQNESDDFPDEPEIEIPHTVKLNGNKSKYAKIKVDKKAFEQTATAAFSQMSDRQKQVKELGMSFLSLMADKTLKENKGPIQKNVEKDILQKLIAVAKEINTDPAEPEGEGSVGLLNLLLVTSLNMRDKYNMLEYRLEKLEKETEKSRVTAL